MKIVRIIVKFVKNVLSAKNVLNFHKSLVFLFYTVYLRF